MRSDLNSMTSPDLDVDQVVVMIAAGMLEARRAALEGVPVDGAHVAQQLHRPVDGGQRNRAVDGDGAAKDLQRVGMVFGLGQDAENDAARTGDSHAAPAQFLFVVQLFVPPAVSSADYAPDDSQLQRNDVTPGAVQPPLIAVSTKTSHPGDRRRLEPSPARRR